MYVKAISLMALLYTLPINILAIPLRNYIQINFSNRQQQKVISYLVENSGEIDLEVLVFASTTSSLSLCKFY
jgi:hypothetical protein